MPHSLFFRLLLFFFVFQFYSVNAQPPLNKLIGGLTSEYFGFNDGQNVSIAPTSDGGFIVAGATQSSKINNVTLVNKGLYDFLVVKIASDKTIQWIKLIGGSQTEYAYKIIQTKDGGYLLGGVSNSSNSGDISATNHGDFDFCLVKLNGSGAIQWTKLYGGANMEDFRSLNETSDGGFILCGSAGTSKSGDITGTLYGYSDIWVVKVKSDGTQEWNKLIGGTQTDLGYSIQQTIDGGYILAGLTKSSSTNDFSDLNNGYYDFAIIKLDKSGIVSWSKLYGSAKYEQASEIQQTADGGYIVAGVTQSSSAPINSPYADLNGWIMKIDNSGNKIWEKILAGTKSDVISGIAQMSDGSLIFSGYSESTDGDAPANNHGKFDYWAMKTTASGNLTWNKNYGGAGDDYATAITKDNSGLLVLAGLSTSSSNGDVRDKNNGFADLWFLTINDSGNIVENTQPAGAELISCYSFNGNTKDLLNLNNATNFGATLTTDRKGVANQAYYFDGKDYIEASNNNTLNDTYTYAAWVKADNLPTYGEARAIVVVGGMQVLMLTNNQRTNGPSWDFWGYEKGSSETPYVTSPVEKPNEWHLVVGVRTANEYKLYVDGILKAKKATQKLPDYLSNTPTILIGKRSHTHPFQFLGKIDEVKIYKGVLTDKQIADMYDLGIQIDKTDLKLSAKSKNQITEKDIEGTISFILKNEGNSTATNIKVFLRIPYTPPFVIKNSQNCSKGTFDSNMWNVPELAPGDSCVLNIAYQPIQNGVWYIEGEVFSADQEDTDSKFNNAIDTEDDFARACMSIPIKVTSDTFGMQLMIEDAKMIIKQWYKDGSPIAGATQSILQVTSVGKYSYQPEGFICPMQGCCPFILEKASVTPNCCVPLEYILKN